MKTRIINTIMALAGFLTLNVACQTEDLLIPGSDMAPEGYMNLRFNVEVPDMSRVSTKAVDPDGGGVQQISVFCFDRNDLFITVTAA